MSAKERILTIRLMEKIDKNPACAEVFGIAVTSKVETLNDAKPCP